MWTKLWELSAQIKEPIPLMACVVAAAMYFVFRKRAPALAWTLLLSVVGVCLVVLILQYGTPEPAYNVRVLTSDEKGDIVAVSEGNIDARIRREKKQVGSEWQFDISPADLPEDRKVEFWAQAPDKYLKRQTISVPLTVGQHQVSAQIVLKRSAGAVIRGIVLNESGEAIKGAHIFVAKAGNKAIDSDKNGAFELTTEAAEGEEIGIHSEAPGYAADNQTYRAGEPVQIVLKKKGNASAEIDKVGIELLADQATWHLKSRPLE